jgi:hypothetical protein
MKQKQKISLRNLIKSEKKGERTILLIIIYQVNNNAKLYIRFFRSLRGNEL